MFLKNYYKALYTTTKSENATAVNYSGGSAELNASYVQNSIQLMGTGYTNRNPNMSRLMNTLASSCGAIIGTGTVPPTMDDYCLSGTLITTFTATGAVTKGSDDLGEYLTALYTITNTGTEDFTIGEIGLIGAGHSGSSSAANVKMLLERTVLDEPVTIPAGGVGQVTYTIRMNYPTA